LWIGKKHAIDVILATCNWPETLEWTLIGFCQQMDLDFSIAFADDGNDRNGSGLKPEVYRFSLNLPP
jgi:hypothetical protein